MATFIVRYVPSDADPVVHRDVELPYGQVLHVGRHSAMSADYAGLAPAEIEIADEAIPKKDWVAISCRHFSVCWNGAVVQVCRRRLPRAPSWRLKLDGKDAPDDFILPPGGAFYLGAFEFRLVHREYRTVLRDPALEATPTTRTLVEGLIKVLGDPAITPENFDAAFLRSICKAIPLIRSAAVIEPRSGGGIVPIACEPTGFRPSETLISHLGESNIASFRQEQFLTRQTLAHIFDWQVCTNIPTDGDERPRVFYLAGVSDENPEKNLERAQALTRLCAELYSVLRRKFNQDAKLELLKRFLPEHARHLLKDHDLASLLKPRTNPSTVIFCDLRNSSALFEKVDADPQGLKLIERALSAMTGPIVQQRGIVSEFLGDAALGFWGWPDAEADDCRVALTAARNIRREFKKLREEYPQSHPLAQLAFGVGLAHGPASMGRVGNFELYKIGIVGSPTVRANRIESLAKKLQQPGRAAESQILLEDTVAEKLPAKDRAMLQALGRFWFKGTLTPMSIFRLLDPEVQDRGCEAYAQALIEWEAGNRDAARCILTGFAEVDGPCCFLDSQLDAKPADDGRKPYFDLR